jgi:hypothetical protein
MASAPHIPETRDGDDEEVRWALSAAAHLFDGREHGEALRWLRKAAAAAEQAGDGARAEELFAAATRLAGELGLGSQRPPDGDPPPTALPRPAVPRRPKPTLQGIAPPAVAQAPKTEAETEDEPTLAAVDVDETGSIGDISLHSLVETTGESSGAERGEGETTVQRGGKKRLPLAPLRVAVMQGGRGAHPFIMLLPKGCPPPEGAALGWITFATQHDTRVATEIFRDAPGGIEQASPELPTGDGGS